MPIPLMITIVACFRPLISAEVSASAEFKDDNEFGGPPPHQVSSPMVQHLRIRCRFHVPVYSLAANSFGDEV